MKSKMIWAVVIILALVGAFAALAQHTRPRPSFAHLGSPLFGAPQEQFNSSQGCCFTTWRLAGGSAVGSTLTLAGSWNASPSNAHVFLNPILASGLSPGAVMIGAGSGEFIGESFHMRGQDGGFLVSVMDSYGASTSFLLRRANGTFASPTALQSGDAIGSVAARGYYVTGGPGFTAGNPAALRFIASEGWTSTKNGAYALLQTDPTGTASPATSFGNGLVKSLTNNTATALVDVATAANAAQGARLFLTFQCTNGTDTQVAVGEYIIGAVNKAGTLTGINTNAFLITVQDANAAANKALSAGTFAITVTAAANGASARLTVTANSSLATITRETVSWSIINMSDGDVTVD